MDLNHNYIFRQYLLLSKTWYMCHLLHKAIARNRLQNIRENKILDHLIVEISRSHTIRHTQRLGLPLNE